MQPILKRLAAAVMAAAALAAAAAAPSRASSQFAVSGTIVPTSAMFDVRTLDGNVLIDASGTHAWAGGLSGRSVVDVHFVEHPSGLLTYQAFLTFDGVTPCGSGTIPFESSGSGPFPGPITGHLTAVDEGGASIPLHADVTLTLFLTPLGAAGTYTGDVRCG